MAKKKESKFLVSVELFAKKIHQILKSDRYVVLGVGGFTGEGKTTFSTKVQKAYAEVSGTNWSFDSMTWSRKELMKWIDGKGKEKIGRKPEYSAILPDELFAMFYRRRWFEDDQIDAIATFNMCRDRHLFIAGNVPDFWDLDTGFIKRVTFYAYVPERGRAWIFQQENNPFSIDKWNVNENKKNFRKKQGPYSLHNFVCEIHFDDWTPEEKKKYLAIRNEKRLLAIKEARDNRKEKYGNIKLQRDKLISYIFKDREQMAEAIKNLGLGKEKLLRPWAKPPSNKAVADIVGVDREVVRLTRGN
jgi:hypothetical protein